jgi:uncharacterized protein YecT (DUF1311 family)
MVDPAVWLVSSKHKSMTRDAAWDILFAGEDPRMTRRGNATNKSRSNEFVAASVGNRARRPGWPIWALFFSFTIRTGAAAAALTMDKDPWEDPATGERQARQAISQCLSRAEKTPGMRPEHCAEAVYQACEKAHGNMSQRDMNECAAFSQRAWEKRLAAIRLILLGPNSAEEPDDTNARLRGQLSENEPQWDKWNERDCELRASFFKGGTMQPFEKRMCLSNHAANRALELESFNGWLSR